MTVHEKAERRVSGSKEKEVTKENGQLKMIPTIYLHLVFLWVSK
jgi:hypothetical protein